ncbi:unnamed protein product [Rhizoctonia solani]|uniref:CFEM domain-containing protein n=1 Tax=Rhizoctonia solani TaxID=456999 RepID=A0A8H2XF31_9AGAM|nr:unnamed protein product [Rhizoctonia solani]CAE7212946.1 unnamed protein product [Rhizoctonia solani]CAE7216397.1 unnamed protein product [Rhizoctonia solani]
MKPIFVFATLFAGYVVAQDATGAPAPSPTPEVSQCVVDCAIQAGQAIGCSPDPSKFEECLCNPNFAQKALECLKAKCTQAEQDEAIAFQQAHCSGTSDPK